MALALATCWAEANSIMTLRHGHHLRLQYFFHRLTLCQFIDQFVQISDLTHRRLLDFLNSDAADYAFDQGSRGIQLGGVLEEGFKIGSLLQMSFQLSLIVAGESADDCINL